MLINISPSQLNDFVRYMDSSLEYETLERLLDKITGEFVMTDKMMYGEAYHKLIETGGQGLEIRNPADLTSERSYIVPIQDRGQLVKTVSILEGMAKPGIEWHNQNQGVYEVRSHKIYDIRERRISVRMNGRIDFSDFRKVVDFKVAERPPKFDDFNQAYQWRCYLDMMELDMFQYEFFIVSHRKKTLNKETFSFFSYPDITADIERMLSRYLEFIEIHDLWENYRISKLQRA